LSFPVKQPKGKAVTPLSFARSAIFNPPTIQTKADELAFKETLDRFVQIKGRIVDDEKSKDLYILVNGKKVYYHNFLIPGDSKSKTDFDALIPLEKGMNRIYLVARDDQDLVFQKNFVVYRGGKTSEETTVEAPPSSIVDLAEPGSH
jgi:hypothetical protein